MSIPERLWRVACGHWSLMNDAAEKVDARLAEADAYKELAETIRSIPAPTPLAVVAVPSVTGSPGTPASSGGEHDPMEACYVLLGMKPGGGMEQLEAAYQARLGEFAQPLPPEASLDRARAEGKRAALEAAYEKLRDALNTTETRFERLEF